MSTSKDFLLVARGTRANGRDLMKLSKETKELLHGIAWGLLYFITAAFAMLSEQRMSEANRRTDK